MKRYLAAALLALAGPAVAAVPIVTLSNTTPANQFFDLDLGINFNVNSPIKVGFLGAFTNGTSPITVTLYKLTTLSTGSVVASAVVSGAPVNGSNYAFTPISQTTLGTGLYQINARYNNPANGNYNPNSGNTATVLFNTLGGSLAFSGSYFNFPGTASIATTLDSVSQLSYGAGTFGVVPEPASWGLMIVGFGMVGVAARRRSRAVAA